jgi:hypothetical protein
MNKTLETRFEDFCHLLISLPFGTEAIEQFLNQPNMIHPFKEHLAELPLYIESISHYPRHAYRFSARIEAFFNAIDVCGLPIDVHAFYQACNEPYYLYSSPLKPYIVALLSCFQSVLLSPSVMQTINEHNREAYRNTVNVGQYIDRLFLHHSRLLVLRVDLAYGQDECVTFEELESDLYRLQNNARHNTLFDEMLGYVFKIEYGMEKKLHVHALFFFNGHKHKSDVYLAQQIGEYWKTVITLGRGCYWNCNQGKGTYKHLGIGDIHFSDAVKRDNLMIAVEYLCKKHQQLIKPHNAPMTKLLRKGQCKLSDSPKQGRPRNESIESLFD